MFSHERQPVQTLSRLSLATIDTIVSARLGTTRVKGNAQPAVFNRQIAMYLAKHVGGWSTTAIGKFYNGRHHTTVLWALKRIGCLRASDPRVEGLLSSLEQEIRSRPVQRELEHGPTLCKITERQLLPFGLDDESLDALADKVAERLQSRGVHYDDNSARVATDLESSRLLKPATPAVAQFRFPNRPITGPTKPAGFASSGTSRITSAPSASAEALELLASTEDLADTD
jgi:hypothetical protein